MNVQIQNRDAMLNYLKEAIDQETTIIQQEQLIEEYNLLSHERKPIQKMDKKPDPPQLQFKEVSLGSWFWSRVLLVVGVVVLIIGGYRFISSTKEIIKNKNYLADTIARTNSTLKNYWEQEVDEQKIILTGSVVLLVLSTVALVSGRKIMLRDSSLEKHLREQYEKELSSHYQKCQQIDKQNDEYAVEYQQAMKEWNDSNAEMNEFLQKMLTESRNLLERYYSNDVIYPKYRTLPALTSIYEYFITGRCEELVGPHGAYNLYEDELRKDTVISQLNSVIDNLEQIKQNQYMLYQQVKAIKENTSTIASELRQIKGITVQIAQLTSLTAYYAALNERHTRIMMYL